VKVAGELGHPGGGDYPDLARCRQISAISPEAGRRMHERLWRFAGVIFG
jgi:hypothetical protein